MQESTNTKEVKEIEKIKNPIINILWDASPLWGHLVLNAVIQTGLSYSIIRAKDCIDNGIQSKILIVPGGSGRIKAHTLGKKGVFAIRKFVEEGGIYIGFCGGAGLALNDGLNICPWGRSFYTDRMQHLVSGHIISNLNQDKFIPNLFNNIQNTEVPLPVWWPGKFQEPENEIVLNELQSPVRVLARYKAMGEDLHVADLPIQKLPASALEDWHNLYGITLRPDLLDGQPAIIAGSFGKGEYVLSYSHLETPDSPFANAIFAHILRESLHGHDLDFSHKIAIETPAKTPAEILPKIYEKAGNACETPFKEHDKTCPAEASVEIYGEAGDSCEMSYPKSPDLEPNLIEAYGNGFAKNILNTKQYSPTWLNPHYQAASPVLKELYEELETLFTLGVDLHLLFPRTVWLYGWNNSVPGSHLNALRIALLRSLLLPRNEKRQQYILTHGASFAQNMMLFIHGAKSWLLAKRLSETITETDLIPLSILQSQKEELFGKHMTGGGLSGGLLDWLDEFLFL